MTPADALAPKDVREAVAQLHGYIVVDGDHSPGTVYRSPDRAACLRVAAYLTATMEAAARGAQVPLGYLSDLAAARCRAGNAEDERDAAERERDLLAETARRLTGERDELAADIDLRDNGPRCITCGEYMGGRASFWGNEAEHYECAVPPQDGESPAAHWKRIRDERQAMVAAAQEAPNA